VGQIRVAAKLLLALGVLRGNGKRDRVQRREFVLARREGLVLERSAFGLVGRIKRENDPLAFQVAQTVRFVVLVGQEKSGAGLPIRSANAPPGSAGAAVFVFCRAWAVNPVPAPSAIRSAAAVSPVFLHCRSPYVCADAFFRSRRQPCYDTARPRGLT
jgi:hypothetical protein